MNIVIAFVGWLLLGVLFAMRFGFQPTLSLAERRRRLASGDEDAQLEQERLALIAPLEGLHTVLKTVATSAFITYCVLSFGVLWGIIVGTVAAASLPLMFRIPAITNSADTVRDAVLPWLAKLAEAARPVLVVLRPRDVKTLERPLGSKTELLELLERSPEVMTAIQRKRLIANLAFDEKNVGAIMTPKTMIRGVEASETLGPLVLDELYKTGFSRFPVYKKDIDHVVGMLYLHDLIDMKTSSKTAEKAMQPKVFYVHEDHTLSHALKGFLTTKHHLFVVVNQYRETVGLLSLEDVIEALIGDTIVDEFDTFDDLRAVAEHNPGRNNEPEGKKDI